MIARAAHKLSGLAAAVALVAAGCIGPVRGPVEVKSGRVQEDGRSLLLGVDSCQGEATVTSVDEAPDMVTVAVEATTSRLGDNDCSDLVEVDLAEPLDGRPVMDETSGRVVIPDPDPR